MIGVGAVYAIAGLVFAAFALLSAWRRRIGNGVFWGLLALGFLLGDRLSDLGMGLVAVALVAIAGAGLVRPAEPPDRPAEARCAEAERRGNRLFGPALVIPGGALAGTIAFKHLPGLVDPTQATVLALTLAVLIALAICYVWLRPAPAEPFAAGLRLMDGIGWAALLPQMLASLGAIFALAGVGDAVGRIVGHVIPAGSVAGAAIVFGIGMAAFTVAMGNAFAAFPVMIAAVGAPLLIRGAGADPAAIGAIGMLTGFCGTLMTPMAANFNIVPAALLELRDRNAVIRAQLPTALILLVVNLAFLVLVSRR